MMHFLTAGNRFGHHKASSGFGITRLLPEACGHVPAHQHIQDKHRSLSRGNGSKNLQLERNDLTTSPESRVVLETSFFGFL